MTSTVLHENFRGLEAIGVVELLAHRVEDSKAKTPGFMDLCYDRLMVEDGGTVVIALAHYYQLNGDSCSDPDMTIRVDLERRTAEALTYQQAIPPIYQEVYPRPGVCNHWLKEHLNGFLAFWLGNLQAQGHRFVVQAKEAAE